MKRRSGKILALVLTFVLCFGTASVFANTYDGIAETKAESTTYTFTKDVIEGKYKLVDTEELKSWVDSKKVMTVVDTMPESSYSTANGHVPGAINVVCGNGSGGAAYEWVTGQKTDLLNAVKADLISKGKTKKVYTYTSWVKTTKTKYKKITNKNLKKSKKVKGKYVYYKRSIKKTSIVADKTAPVVVYCGFIGCARSHIAAKYLTSQGYTNVYRYGGGILAWKDAGYDVETVIYNQISQASFAGHESDYVVLDVRKAADYAEAHIDGSILADCDGAVSGDDTAAAEANIAAAIADKPADAKYVLVCYSGNRYAKAATEILVKQGIKNKNVLILTGGFNEYKKNNDVVIARHYIAPATLKDAMDSYTMLDVRKAADFETAHIPGAISADCDGAKADITDKASAANIAAAIAGKDASTKYALICYSGNAYATAATKLLVRQGVNPANIFTLGEADGSEASANGGMKAWNAAGYPVQMGDVIADKANKTVSFDGTINSAKVGEPTMHYIVCTSGKQAGNALFNTPATAKDVRNALVWIGGKEWNTTKFKTIANGEKITSTNGDNADFSKLDLDVTIGGTEYSMADTLTTNNETSLTIDMAFAGNYESQLSWDSGCIACNSSCYAGITANAGEGFGDNDNRVISSSVVPSSGDVSFVMTLK